MSEPIKQTLFSFRTMRAPELLSDQAKTNYYIQHFNGTTGDFFTAVANMQPTDVKKTVLQTAAQNFADKKTKAQLIAMNPDLHELGLTLIKNRNSITVAEATAAVTGVVVLTNAQRRTVWDNLFYQTITLESGYVRETLLVMLLANHFVTNFSGIPSTDEDMQKWANSRVVLPAILFKGDPTFTAVTTTNDTITGQASLSAAMSAAIAAQKISQVEKAKTELATYKTAFLKTNNALEKAAIDAHHAAIKTAQDNATKVDYVDQFSQFTFKKFTNYTHPTFNYTKPDEVDSDPMGTAFTEETHHLLTVNNLYTSKTFEELELALDDLQTKLTAELFEKGSFQENAIAVEGSLISKCGMDSRFRKPYGYQVKLVERSTGKYSILLTLDAGQECLELEEAVTTGSVPQNSRYTSKTSVSDGHLLTIDLTDGQSANLGNATSLTIGVELTFNTGLKLGFNTQAITTSAPISGTLTLRNPVGSPTNLQIPNGFGVRRLGITDYRKLEQTLCCYVPGEVSHIENVMAREYKERSTRRLRRQEDTTTTTKSSESENQTDTTSTSRFDLQKEVAAVLSSTIESNKSNSLNSSLGGSKSTPLGDVDFTIGADFSSDFSTTNSTENSNSESTSFAKEVTEKALSRVISKVSEERITKIIEEFEEKNQHGFDNRKGAEHISGVFRWVDKVYKNEIRNYGKRLQYEFMIPEPGEFHTISRATAAASVNTFPIVKPNDPRSSSFGSLSAIKNATHINETNYYQWAAAYGATVLVPPKKYITLGKTMTKPNDGTDWFVGKTVSEQITLPDGYAVESIHVSIGCSDDVAWNYVDISAAGITKRYYDDILHHGWFADSTFFPELKWAHGEIPISAHFIGHQSGTITVNAKLVRKPSLLEEWQLDTFNAIIAAYNDRLAEYKTALADLEAKQRAITAENTAYYREIERTVLRKTCISYLTGHNYLGQDFTAGNEIGNHQVNTTAAMDKYAATVKFFEQAFEWNLMSYQFYPFYWANRNRWHELYSTKNDDALFKAFLSAGMARVIVTARPGFEEAVMYFMTTGLIWNGGEVPVLEDDLYLSIVEEFKDPEYTLDETWETRVPSTLNLIQAKTIALNAEGLPCYCDTTTPPVEDIVVPDPNPLTNLDVFIEGDTNV